jgi:hypothetical protein
MKLISLPLVLLIVTGVLVLSVVSCGKSAYVDNDDLKPVATTTPTATMPPVISTNDTGDNNTLQQDQYPMPTPPPLTTTKGKGK